MLDVDSKHSSQESRRRGLSMLLRALCSCAAAVRYLHVVQQYARGDVPERAAEFCLARPRNPRLLHRTKGGRGRVSVVSEQ